MRKPQSVVTLDPISVNNKRRPGVIRRFFMTRRFKGKSMSRCDPFGHYLFCGRQRQGKTTSAVWFRDFLTKRYLRQGKKVILFDNMGLSKNQFDRFSLPNVINSCVYNEDTIYIFLIDEIQSWFPKDTKDKTLLSLIDTLTGQFSQLGKRQIYVISTAQVYGRLNKNLREQCLFMVNCRRSFFNKCVNEFIDGDDILCDELGRWSGNPSRIYIHGLPDSKFDTHFMIK